MQRFTSVTRMLQRSVMCVSKALTPHEEHGGSTYGDRRNSERSQKATESATRTKRSKRQGEAASDRAERPGADGSGQTEWQAPDAKRQTADNEHAQRRRAPSNRPLRPSKGVVTENGAMGPFCRVNYSRKGEWLTARNTFCLIGGNIDFMAKLHPAKNRPPSRHFWHRNTIPMQ